VGSGKSTIISRLLAADPGLWFSRSWTTRAQRPGEPDDWYHFVDRERFLEKVAEDGFVEHAEVAGHLYGTPSLDAPEGKDVLLEIDVQGARQILERYPDAVMILVVPPSRAVQEERLRKRGDDPETVARRLAISEREEEVGRKLAQHVAVNDDLYRAVEEVAGIIGRHRAARAAGNA